ncbi:AMP-dependent synthetase/ligase [Almyronema epifaneia]|uniref:AMP-dependent synthetase/ligase n=1 Tax=Almyronema epifaneia S1 TaxID=2991925 RepID=A0ABW6IJ26_9CYAN
MTACAIYRAPPNAGNLVLNQILPTLLDQACDRFPNALAFNHWHNRRWQSMSNNDFRAAAAAIALGLLDMGLQPGDRVALMMSGDVAFCLADMGCLLAGLVNVPIDLTQTIENVIYSLKHAEVSALIVSNTELLEQVAAYLAQVPSLRSVVVGEGLEKTRGQGDAGTRGHAVGAYRDMPTADQPTAEKLVQTNISPQPPEDCLQLPQFLHELPLPPSRLAALPERVQLLSLDQVRSRGQAHRSPERINDLKAAIAPSDLATILYIASDSHRPKGVMLTHESIAANVIAAFSSYPDLGYGAEEVALIFLPLTHIFARVFLYGHMAYGHSVYFSDANHVVKHLRTVKPTIMITVPRLIEKTYERICDRGQRLGKFDRTVFNWALQLAHRYELGTVPSRLYRLQLKLADRLVFAKWRAAFGDRLKALISGGAALKAELANVFSAAGIPVLQGYGLTETSAVLCYNRGNYNRAGTVGVPIAGVEIDLATDGEILVKSPFVMQGYYRDPVATERVLQQGWLYTGDLGEITPEGFLKITGVKKPLFKLSTGKYVSSLPLEQDLARSPLVEQAIAVGANHKFCSMLIFPNLAALHQEAAAMGLSLPTEALLQHACITARYQALIDAANCHLPYWSTVRKFALVNAVLTLENGCLNPDGSLNRVAVLKEFAPVIAALYGKDGEGGRGDGGTRGWGEEDLSESCPMVPAAACPTYAQSLTHY